jgi:hypothetical protein
MPMRDPMSSEDTQPGPNEPDPMQPEPIEPVEPPRPAETPEEFPFTQPKHYPIHPDIPEEPIYEPAQERPIA